MLKLVRCLILFCFTLWIVPLGAFIAGRVMLATGRHKPLQIIGALLVPFALVGLTPTGANTVAWISAVMRNSGAGRRCTSS